MIYNLSKIKELYSDEELIKMFNEYKSLRKIEQLTNIARHSISKILSRNGIKIITNQMKRIAKIPNYKCKYKSEDKTKKYIAIDKKVKRAVFSDVNNVSGALTKYLYNAYGIVSPNAKDSYEYFLKTNNYWYEEYFDFKLVDVELKTKYRFTKSCGYWNDKERCFKEASKYGSKGRLNRYGGGCYDALVRNGWMKEAEEKFFKNKQIQYRNPNEKIHSIYVYEINEFKTCYIGRTNNMERRDYQHRKGCWSHGEWTYDNLYKFCKENNIVMPQPKMLEENLNAEESQIREEYWLYKYIDDGWNALNKGKVGLNIGSLGALPKWNYETCKKEAEDCYNREAFRKKNIVAYNVARKNKWLDNFNFTPLRKPKGYWNNFQNCQNEAIKYSSKKEFKKAYPSAYEYCRVNKFLDKLKFKDE